MWMTLEGVACSVADWIVWVRFDTVVIMDSGVVSGSGMGGREFVIISMKWFQSVRFVSLTVFSVRIL